MGERRTTCRPIGRLSVAVLIVILTVTSVLGAGCAEAPSGAVANAHASIGAALIHAQPSAGRGEDGAGSGRTAAQERTVEELPPSQVTQPPAGQQPVDLWLVPLVSSPAVPSAHHTVRSSRAVPGNPSRAPPA